METIRAKFLCNAVTTNAWGTAPNTKSYTAIFTPVTANDVNPENKKFWEATPNGKLEMTTIKQSFFEPGKEYYLDFTPTI